MIYKFITLADIHWGAMDSSLTYRNLQMVLDFIRKMKGELDFVVIAGDYFDYRIQLNSKTALFAVQWMDELVKTCRETGVKKIRIVKGTHEHDNDQLEVFRPTYEDETGFYKIFNTTTSEDLLEDLRVIYCPDETMNLEDYWPKYGSEFIPNPDIGFFHGNFDYNLPEIEFNRITDNHLATIIYQYDRLGRFIKGPMISGHWHVATEHGSAYYVGSFDRWIFGEEEPKGFIFGAYDTETSQYFIRRIENPNARIFKTRMIASEEVKLPSDFAVLTEQIRNEIKADPTMKMRIIYLLSTEDLNVLNNFNTFQRHFANNSQVRVVLKDLIKKAERKKKKDETQVSSDKYSYVFNSDIRAIPSIIHQFILDKKNMDVPMPSIEKYIGKYLEEFIV